MKKSKNQRYFIYSLERGLRVLEAFSSERKHLSLSEVAQMTNMSLPTTTRYLYTLKDLGYLNLETTTNQYHLTTKTLSLGFEALNSMDIITKLRPYLMQLNREFNVTSQLAILDGMEIVLIERIRAKNVTNLELAVGTKMSAYGTSLGRAMLAYFDINRLQEYLKKVKFKRLTPYTITKKKELMDELEKTRQRGYAINMQEYSLGWGNFAAPVFKGTEVEGAFGVAFPYYLTENKKFIESLTHKILEIANKFKISR
jgi:IclR family pca regulon transcriptional regulator